MPVRTKDLEALRAMLLEMAEMVEAAIRDSVASLVERNDSLAEKVIKGDHAINALDVRIDEKCIKLIALMQPMGEDLRLITTAMKITTDLERMADNAVNIAERALELNPEPILKPYIDIPEMCRISQGMVRDSIEAFVRRDKALALDVIKRDDIVDDLNEAVFEELFTIMKRDASAIGRAVKITHVSKYIERIADHATNVAEMVVYMIEGKIIRHMEPPP